MMRSGLFNNLIGGASTVVRLFPPPLRMGSGEEILRRSNEDALRFDWCTIGDHLSAAIKDAAGNLAHDGKPQQA
jgi:hypothetical protein